MKINFIVSGCNHREWITNANICTSKKSSPPDVVSWFYLSYGGSRHCTKEWMKWWVYYSRNLLHLYSYEFSFASLLLSFIFVIIYFFLLYIILFSLPYFFSLESKQSSSLKKFYILMYWIRFIYRTKLIKLWKSFFWIYYFLI